MRKKEAEKQERRERKAKKASKEDAENRSRSPLKLLQKQESDPVESSRSRQTSKSPARDITEVARSNDKQQTPPLPSRMSGNPISASVPAQPSPVLESQPPPTATQTKSAPPKVETASFGQSSPPSSSFSSTYDKRMPPPSVDWRGKGGSLSRPSRNEKQKVSQGESVVEPTIAKNMMEQSDRKSNMESIVNKMVQEAQKPDAPAAKGSFITGKRNQLDFRNTEGALEGLQDDLEERKIVNGYIRDGDDRIGILSSSWKEVPSIIESNRKSPAEHTESSSVSKKRKLRSEYCPASHTTWKPSWIDTTQCYPVDQSGEDMSDLECLRGDGIHRNADKLKQILETECMYIPTHRVDDLMAIAEETYNTLKLTKEFYTNDQKRIRIERHQFM